MMASFDKHAAAHNYAAVLRDGTSAVDLARSARPPAPAPLQQAWEWCQAAYLLGHWDDIRPVLDAFLTAYQTYSNDPAIYNDLGLMDYLRRLLHWHHEAGTTPLRLVDPISVPMGAETAVSKTTGKPDVALTVIADSHALGLAHVPVVVKGRAGATQSFYVRGAKLHDLLATRQSSYWRSALAALERSSAEVPVLWCFGQLDCRLNSGLFRAVRQGQVQDIDGEIGRLAQGYVSRVLVACRDFERQLLVMGIPAPNHSWSALSAADKALMVHIVRRVNEELRECCRRLAVPFVDVYAATAENTGVSNGQWHIDEYHLAPNFLSKAFS